jgi:NitT/TauT family transport system ATP-binding protein
LYITHDIEEAIVLGDRVLVMTGRPGRICEEIPIPLSRPRQLLNRDYPEVKALKWHIWHLFEAEVRQSLGPSR